MGNDRDTQPIGVFSALLGAAIAAGILGAIITLGAYALWYWVIRPDLVGRAWTWAFDPPGPFQGHWWNFWVWMAGMLFILAVPKSVLTSIRSRRPDRSA